MTNNFKYVGKSIPTSDARKKATGKIRYIDDMTMKGMLYAKLLLSDIAHGEIINIDTSKAEDLPGVEAVFTYKNSPNRKYNSHKFIESQDDLILDEKIFSKRVRYVGDRIAAVVAKDRYTAEKAVKLIEVEYKKLPVILDPRIALKKDSVDIHSNGNITFSKKVECGNVDGVFKNAVHIIEDEISTQKQHHAAMETHICLAAPDYLGGITIWSPCQVVFQVRLIVSEALNMSLNKIRVVKVPMGGSFGGKGQPILEPICAFLSKEVGAPIKLHMDRTQSIIGTRTRNAVIGKVRTAINSEGKIIGRDINVLVDNGAYFTNGRAVNMAMAKKAFRLYRIDNQRYTGTSVYTNTPIGGACRGYGSPQIHTITEININNAARKINMDPAEFRIRNLVHPYDDDPLGGPNLGNARVIDCIKSGMEDFKWKDRWNKPRDAGRYIRGVGTACATHGNGYYGALPDFITMSIRITEDNGVFLNSAIHDLGCGTVTTMQQIIAEVLDISPYKILVPEGDTLFSHYDSAGTQASRVTFVCGGCAKKVAEMVKVKLINYACKIFECSKQDIVMRNGIIWSKKKSHIKKTYGEIVIEVKNRFKDDIMTTYTYKSPSNPGVYAANFVEVEIDKMTGLVRVVDMLAVHDIGRAINKGFVEGQIQGACQMAIGYALTEDIEINKDGSIKTKNFSKYHLINAPDMPDVRVLLIEKGEKDGPFGAKSVGEICAVPGAAAIINAINNTLDININSLPATPEKVLQAIKEK
ncbi:xanthine dehydrogenase family protein molybdopterin-binding subunit [Maledivibacter halophilus]|uniref:CO or xanthine dehydrogenase, Mo-binding subunit n=1 Tax=Maledivibacter halophilus TaxID=36842 RepID=A0A1T5MA25_9FIRM|nr:molybdopterin cofactor-binding domain-containing protein [Maledivibacter halophilus]SKC84844.1 CO or xanthine dehydrogenase, Mo-binding subunit [Maledivibacter halophilus]